MRYRHSISRLGGLMVAACLGLSGSADAQACLGVPTYDGEGFLTGHASFTEGAWAPGGTLGYDADGPISVSSTFDYTFIDNSNVEIASVSGNVVLEVPNLRVSVCPGFGGGYRWLAQEGELAGVDADGVVFGGGVAVGGRLETRSDFAIIPYAGAAVVHDRATVRFGDFSGTASDTYGSFWLGFSIAAGTVYLGPSVSFITEEGSNAVFTAALGATF